MMTSPMRSVLVLSVLLQLIPQTRAEDPAKIFLILDNNAYKEQYGSISKKLTNTPIKLNGESLSQNQHDEVNKAGKKILYISAKFEEEAEKLTWGAGKSAEDLATIVSKVFSPESPDVFVTVVFPEKCLKTYWGYEFVDKFEEKIQKSNKNIGIGIPRVEINLFADQKMPSIDAEIKVKETVPNSILYKTMNSIFFKLEGNKLALFSSKQWIEKTDINFDSVLNGMQKMKIEEAEMVIIDIKADCGTKYNADNVAAAVKSILGTRWHEHQRININLRCPPEDANREDRSKTLIGIIKQQLKERCISGEMPNVVTYVATTDFLEDVEKKKTGHSTQLYEMIYAEGMYDILDAQHKPAESKVIISPAKEVSLEVNCHGRFELESAFNTICELEPQGMAETIEHLFSGIGAAALDAKRIELILYACNSGTTKGQTYVTKLLDELHNKYKKSIIDEVISFVGWSSQLNSEFVIAVPLQLKFDAESILSDQYSEELTPAAADPTVWQAGKMLSAYEHVIYGRFTVRTKWDGKKYIKFPVLPASEYEVYRLKKGRG